MAKTAAQKKADKAAKTAAAKANTAQPANTGSNLADLLTKAAQASATGQPFMATETEMTGLLTDPRGPLVEFNKDFRNGDQIAFRATALGVQMHQAGYQPPQAAPFSPPAQGGWGAPGGAAGQPSPQPQANPAPNPGPKSPAGPRPTVTFDDGVPVPSPRRGGRNSGVYGFETMNIGQSFFIAASADNPNPAKRIASTVSSASERLAPKKFIVRSVDETAQGRGKGARVWRAADVTEGE
jgi:hypothetical protein